MEADHNLGTKVPITAPTVDPDLLHELVDHLRQSQASLREEWARALVYEGRLTRDQQDG